MQVCTENEYTKLHITKIEPFTIHMVVRSFMPKPRILLKNSVPNCIKQILIEIETEYVNVLFNKVWRNSFVKLHPFHMTIYIIPQQSHLGEDSKKVQSIVILSSSYHFNDKNPISPGYRRFVIILQP